MTEEELNEIIKQKNKYELISRITKEWLDFIYDIDRDSYDDGLYKIKIEKNSKETKELIIHLPTVVNAMEKYRDTLYEEYKNELDKNKQGEAL